MNDYYKDLEEIKEILSQIAGAQNRRRIVRYLLSASLVGTCVNIIVFAISKFVILQFSLLIVASVIFGISISTGLVIAIKERSTKQDIARSVDNKMGLSDRLITAADLIYGKVPHTALSKLQVKDTLQWLKQINLDSVLEPRFLIWHGFLPAAVIILIATYFLPLYYAEPKEVSQAIRHAGKEIQRVASDLNDNELSNMVADIVRRAQDAGKAMQSRHFTKKESLQRISKLSRHIEAIRTTSELANELNKEMTPERKKLIAELIGKLSQDLRDIPELSNVHKVVSSVNLDRLSDDVLKALASALSDRRLSTSDFMALIHISDRLAMAKQTITRGIASDARTSTFDKESSQKTAGTPGEGAPGSEEGTSSEAQDRKGIDTKQVVELPTGVSEDGRLLTTGIHSRAEISKSNVPYQRLYAIYKGSADHEISTQVIPRAYRQQVIRYFDSIRPDALQPK